MQFYCPNCDCAEFVIIENDRDEVCQIECLGCHDTYVVNEQREIVVEKEGEK